MENVDAGKSQIKSETVLNISTINITSSCTHLSHYH